MKIKKRAGKPNKTVVTKLRGLAWCNALSIRSDGMKFPQLEYKLLPELISVIDGKKNRPKLIDKYFQGVYTPKNNTNRKGKFNLIERTETVFPGTAHWFLNPMWDLMEVNNLDLKRLYSILIKVQISNRDKFFVQPDLDISAFQRNSWTEVKDIKVISEEPSLNAFIFLLGIMRESIIRLNALEHYQCCLGLRRLVPVIWETPELKYLVGDIFDYLERTYFSVTYTTYGVSQMYLSKTWRDMHPAIAKQYPATLDDQTNLRQPFLQLIEV